MDVTTRAQRRADLRAERYRQREEARHAAGIGPGLLERLSADRQQALPWLLRGVDAKIRLVDEVYAQLHQGPVSGPDGVEVSIRVGAAGLYWTGRSVPGNTRSRMNRFYAAAGVRPSLKLLLFRTGYRVWANTMSGPLIEVVRWFPSEEEAACYAVGLAKGVRAAGIDALRRAAG